jgi:hypothetical protein
MNPRAFQINSSDSVTVLLDDAQPGPVSLLGSPVASLLPINQAIRLGHKIAVRPHEVSEEVIKIRRSHWSCHGAPTASVSAAFIGRMNREFTIASMKEMAGMSV